MQYHEFLRLIGKNEKDVTKLDYRAIERLYMTRDDLFATKEDVVDHYHRFGLRGFRGNFIDRLDRLSAAITDVLVYDGAISRDVSDCIFRAATDLAERRLSQR